MCETILTWISSKSFLLTSFALLKQKYFFSHLLLIEENYSMKYQFSCLLKIIIIQTLYLLFGDLIGKL